MDIWIFGCNKGENKEDYNRAGNQRRVDVPVSQSIGYQAIQLS